MNQIKITNTNGVLTVSSLQVAEDFEKRHDNVIRDIETLISLINGGLLKIEETSTESSKSINRGLPKIGEPPAEGLKFKVSDYFIETTYQHPQNKQWYKCYNITRDGFALLAMGFTGKKALVWKLQYIEAFNNMERQLININSSVEEIVKRELDEKMEGIVNKVFDERMSSVYEIIDKVVNSLNKSADSRTENIIKNIKESIMKTADTTIQGLIPCFVYIRKKLKKLYKELKNNQKA